MNNLEYWSRYLEQKDNILYYVSIETGDVNIECEYVEIILKNEENKNLFVYGIREATDEFIDSFFASDCRFKFKENKYEGDSEGSEDHIIEEYDNFIDTRKSVLAKYFRIAYTKILEQDIRLFPEKLTNIEKSSENNIESGYSILKSFKKIGDVRELEIIDINKHVYYLLLAKLEDDWIVAVDDKSMITRAIEEFKNDFNYDDSFLFNKVKISNYFYADELLPASFFNTKYEDAFYLTYYDFITDKNVGMKMIDIVYNINNK